MNKHAKEWVKKNTIPAFFAVAVLINYTMLFPAMYLLPRDNSICQIVGYYMSSLGTWSPAIAAIFIARLTRPGRPRASFSGKLAISLPVWLIAVAVNIANLKFTAAPGASLAGLVILSMPVSLLPAWVITSAFSGSDDVRKMLRTLSKPGGHITWYLVALFTFPVITVCGAVITNIWNGNALLPQVNNAESLLLTSCITFFSVLFFSGGLNEESGWRGLAQVRLQANYSPLVTAVILWLFLVIWHIPNDIVQYHDGGYLLVRIGLYPFITILFSWIFIRTRGNIWPVAVFHASMNTMNPLMGVFPVTAAGNIMLVAFALIVVFADRMWRKLPKDHPAVFQEA